VDANILIFERMKEELKRGKSLHDSLHEGFSRAWLSIRDSNISSIITAVILFWLGTSAIKGFALTLGFGVLISMFTAITVSRTFLFAIAPKQGNKEPGNFVKFLFSNGLHFKN
jgi:preprotein translocase subunit SecD